MSKWLIGALVGAGLAVVIGIFTFNGLNTAEQAVNEKVGFFNSAIQRRADLIPNLVATVQGSASFEKSTLNEVTEARAKVGAFATIDASELASNPELQKQLEAALAQMSGALSRLIAVAEAYPDIKSTQNFRDLQTQLEGTENRINTARQDVQTAVANYNAMAINFPGMFFGRPKKDFYQAEAGSEKPPVVSFPAN